MRFNFAISAILKWNETRWMRNLTSECLHICLYVRDYKLYFISLSWKEWDTKREWEQSEPINLAWESHKIYLAGVKCLIEARSLYSMRLTCAVHVNRQKKSFKSTLKCGCFRFEAGFWNGSFSYLSFISFVSAAIENLISKWKTSMLIIFHTQSICIYSRFKAIFSLQKGKNWKRENWFQQKTKTEICASNKWKSQPFESHKDH